jgi:type I restriction enzyme M protein
MGKTNPLNDDDLAEFVALQKTFADSPKSWSVDVAASTPAPSTCRSRTRTAARWLRCAAPQDILDEIAALDAESAEVLATIGSWWRDEVA